MKRIPTLFPSRAWSFCVLFAAASLLGAGDDDPLLTVKGTVHIKSSGQMNVYCVATVSQGTSRFELATSFKSPRITGTKAYSMSVPISELGAHLNLAAPVDIVVTCGSGGTEEGSPALLGTTIPAAGTVKTLNVAKTLDLSNVGQSSAGTLEGYAHNQLNQTLPDVHVVASGDGGLIDTTTTDDTGRFDISLVPSFSTVTFEADKTGYVKTLAEVETGNLTSSGDVVSPIVLTRFDRLAAFESELSNLGVSQEDSKGVIFGRVSDALGHPIGDATVRLTPEGLGEEIFYFSTADGTLVDAATVDSGRGLRQDGGFAIVNVDLSASDYVVTAYRGGALLADAAVGTVLPSLLSTPADACTTQVDLVGPASTLVIPTLTPTLLAVLALLVTAAAILVLRRRASAAE